MFLYHPHASPFTPVKGAIGGSSEVRIGPNTRSDFAILSSNARSRRFAVSYTHLDVYKRQLFTETTMTSPTEA